MCYNAINIVFISERVLLNGKLVHEPSGESLTRVRAEAVGRGANESLAIHERI